MLDPFRMLSFFLKFKTFKMISLDFNLFSSFFYSLINPFNLSSSPFNLLIFNSIVLCQLLFSICSGLFLPAM